MHYEYSIIAPHYNSGELLPRMLDSIPRRDDIQVIVVDDCSTDGSFERWQADPAYGHVQFIQAEQKVYAGGARNLALAHAEGRYALFADSDDLFTDNAFEIFDREVASGEELILFKTCSFIESSGLPGNRDNYRNARLLQEPRAAALGAVGPIAKLVSMGLIRQHGLYFSEVIAANDIAFSVKAACLAKNIKVVQEVVYQISQGEESLTATVSLEKSMSRLNEQSKRISLVRKYKPVPVFRYCLMHSLLVRFEQLSAELKDRGFDQALAAYRKELGWVICIMSKIISKTPFAARSLVYIFRLQSRLASLFRRNNYLHQD